MKTFCRVIMKRNGVSRAGKSPLCLSLTQLFSLTRSTFLKNLWQNQVLFRSMIFASIHIQGCAQILSAACASAAAMDAELPPRCGDTSVSLNNAQFEQFPQFCFLTFFLWFPAARQKGTGAVHHIQQPCPGKEAAEHLVKCAQPTVQMEIFSKHLTYLKLR